MKFLEMIHYYKNCLFFHKLINSMKISLWWKLWNNILKIKLIANK